MLSRQVASTKVPNLIPNTLAPKRPNIARTLSLRLTIGPPSLAPQLSLRLNLLRPLSKTLVYRPQYQAPTSSFRNNLTSIAFRSLKYINTTLSKFQIFNKGWLRRQDTREEGSRKPSYINISLGKEEEQEKKVVEPIKASQSIKQDPTK